ncbi:MAG: hypothetical protein ACM3PV_01760 [Betaproteobacteria bacterium]
MTPKPGLWAAGTVLLLLCSCSGESRRSSTARPTATPPVATAAAAPVRALDVCALAPDAEVAKALGAKVRTPARGSQRATGSSCDYDLDFGDRHAGLFFVWTGKPSVYFSRELASGKTEAVPGLGQDAWVEHSMPEDSWDLHVLVAPDLAFEAKGDNKARVLTLGRFLAERLH